VRGSAEVTGTVWWSPERECATLALVREKHVLFSRSYSSIYRMVDLRITRI
jgi:hypothetical protein